VRLLFAGKQHFEVGGVESSTDQLARRLLARGHEVAVLASPRSGTASGFSRIEQVPEYPYPAFAAHGMPPAQALAEIQRRIRADAVVVNAGGKWWHDWTRPLLSACSEVPSVLYICDREAVELLALGLVRPDVVWTVADSHTTAARAVTSLPVITVPSLVEPELYRTETTGEVVLYVNPVKSKGVRTAITLAAARRDIPFVFLRSWGWSNEKFAELSHMATTLGNVEVAASTPDPREHYARARLLLAPYDDHGRPRVIAEAQLSGIPFLALDEAGNREATGAGGILVEREAAISAWVHALGRIWDDSTQHRALAEAALAHSRRPEMDPAVIVEAVEAGIADAIGRFRASARSEQPDALTVSVVLAVRNGADTIDDQLEALSHQTYTGRWELVVSDNGSTDGTRGRVLAWQGGMPAEIRIVDSSERRGAAHARNVGIREARGAYVLICDADDVVGPDWIKQLALALHDHEIVTGFSDRRRFNTPDQYDWWMRTDADLDRPIYGHRRHASGGNMGVRRDLALTLAGFEETLLRTEDVDWSWRAHYAGREVWFEPSAVVHIRMSDDLRAVARTYYRGGYAEPLLYRRHRAHGMASEPASNVADEWRWLAHNARRALREPELRYRWTANAARRVGRVIGSVRHRALYL
jgi:glycosyltransferase involved in cell wall biosynthesis